MTTINPTDSTTTNEFVTISKAEYDKLVGDKQFSTLSPTDIDKIMEYKDVFTRFIRVSQNLYRGNMWACRYKGKENLVYDGLEAFEQLIKNIDNANVAYRSYIEQMTKEGVQL